MKLKKVGGLFVLDSTYAEREAAKAAGFRFHWPENCRNRTTCQACKAGIGKGWWTADAVIASRLIDHADEETRKLLTETRAAIAESKAGESDITVPVPPGLNYLPFQKAGIAYASTRKGTLIGDEMGLGKTIQALGLVNHLGIGSVLVVCPAGLRINWLREAKKWLVAPKTYYVVENNDPIPRSADFVIVNYDRLGKQSIRLGLLERRWGLLVVDECHYCFPYKTIVETDEGPVAIGEIVDKHLPVSVLSCDSCSNVLEYKQVTGYVRLPSRTALVKVVHEHGQFECTEDHEIYTTAGYAEAGMLKAGEELYFLRPNIPIRLARQEEKRSPEILRQQLCSEVEDGTTGPERTKPGGSTDCFSSKSWTQEAGCQPKDARTQSHVGAGIQGQDDGKGKRKNFSVTWRQSENNRSANAISGDSKIADRICDKNGSGEATIRMLASSVQGGHSRSGEESGHRSRWTDAQVASMALPGCQENARFIKSRVVRVEVLERAGDKRYRDCGTDYPYVYCLSVADNENFFADGILVSNCKNPGTPKKPVQRTQAVLGSKVRRGGEDRVVGVIERADRAVFLTGTPILNKPMEIQTLAGALQPALFGNRFYFGKRYAGAYQDRWGWHFDGATHLPELQERLRATFMIRRLKADVLTELPPKRRQVIELPMNGCEDAVRAEQELYAQHEDQIRQAKAAAAMAHASGDEEEYRAAVAKLREALQVSFSEMSRARHELALAKVPAVVEHVQECLEQVEKVVVFCHHRDVAGAIAQGLGRPGVDYTIAVVTGEDEHGLRQAKVDSFQGGKDVRVFVGTIGSCGVGITLNAASLAVFAELDWVPANVTQAEDRLHRIGQVNPVLIQHLVIDGSLDARMAKTLVEKQEVIDAALDDPCDFVTPVIEPEEEKRPKSYPKPTEEQREWTRDALLRMSGRCDGARKLDGMGFNKIDAWLGHKLAETAAASTLTDGQVWLAMRILMKYRGQIGEAPGKEVETS